MLQPRESCLVAPARNRLARPDTGVFYEPLEFLNPLVVCDAACLSCVRRFEGRELRLCLLYLGCEV